MILIKKIFKIISFSFLPNQLFLLNKKHESTGFFNKSAIILYNIISKSRFRMTVLLVEIIAGLWFGPRQVHEDGARQNSGLRECAEYSE